MTAAVIAMPGNGPLADALASQLVLERFRHAVPRPRIVSNWSLDPLVSPSAAASNRQQQKKAS